MFCSKMPLPAPEGPYIKDLIGNLPACSSLLRQRKRGSDKETETTEKLKQKRETDMKQCRNNKTTNKENAPRPTQYVLQLQMFIGFITRDLLHFRKDGR